MTTSAHETLAAALAAFQAALPRIGKDNRATVKSDKGTYTYTYANLADVSEKVLPLLARHGLSFSTKPTLHEDRFVLEYRLRHTSGEEDIGYYPLGNGTPQQVGSAITYARRYALCAVTGVAPDVDDDDGQAAEQGNLRPRIDPADAARARLKATIRRHGWDEEIVVGKFAERYPAGIDAETDQGRIDKFREWLASQPQHELTGDEPASANGATR